MICIIEMSFAVFNMDKTVCHTEVDDLIKPQVWLLTMSSVEVLLLLVTVGCCYNTFIIVCSWMLALIYMVIFFIGVNMAWDDCLYGNDITGAFFIGFSLFAGIYIAYRNIILIDEFYEKRLQKGNVNEGSVNDVYYAWRV